MNNLTTRKIVLGMLMALVLAFSVQGIADALTFSTSRSGDLDTVVIADPEFKIRFSVSLKRPERIQMYKDYKQIPSRDTDRVDVDVEDDYYDDSEGDGYQGNEDAVTYAEAHYYDQESIGIAVRNASLKKVGRYVASGVSHTMYERTHDVYDDAPDNQKFSGSVELTLTADVIGPATITITDSSAVEDRKGETPEAIIFTVYVVQRSSLVDEETLEITVKSENYNFSDDYDDRINIEVGGNATPDNVPTKFEIIDGSGRLYVKQSYTTPSGFTRPPDSVGRSNRVLDTSDGASIFLDTNGGTNRVKVSIPGVPSATAIFVYGRPSIQIVSRDDPTGVLEGRLEEPFVVKVVDGKGRGVPIPMAIVTFSSGAEAGSRFLPVSSTTVHVDATDNWASSFTDIDDIDDPVTATSIYPIAASASDVVVQADRSGEARVYFQLGSALGRQNVTVSAVGASPATFRPTALRASRSASLVLVSGNNQRSDADTHDVEDPLVVLVRRTGGYRIPNVILRFTALSGTLEVAPGTNYVAAEEGVAETPTAPYTGTDVTIPDADIKGTASGQEIFVVTGPGGEAAVLYNVGQLTGAKEVTARVDDELSEEQYNYQIRQVEFNIDGRAAPEREPEPPPREEPPPVTPPPSLSADISGAPGSQQTLSVSTNAAAQVTVGLSGDSFITAGGRVSQNSFTGSRAVTITLPNTVGAYTLTVTATTTGGTVRDPRTIRVVEADNGAQPGAQPGTGGTVSIGIQPSSGGPGTTATVTVTATPAASVAVTLRITAGGGTFANGTTTTTVTTGTTGTTAAILTLGSAPGSNYYITVSLPTGYTFRGPSSGERVIISGAQPPTGGAPTTTGPAAELDDYDGNNQSGSLNSRLAEPLVVEVVDANDNPVEDVRVRFSTTIGSGRFSPRTPRTDEDGFAETTFTPTSAGRIRVVATVAGVDDTAAFTVQAGDPADALVKVSGDTQSGTPGNALAAPFVVEVQDEDGEPLSGHSVTFTVTAGGGSLSETSATADEDGRAQTTLTLGSAPGINSVEASVTGVDPVTFSTSIDAKILVAAANRPVMYWIAGGGLYRLSGAKEAKIAESANGVAVGGGKIYWTSQVNASSGAINSANLDGTNATVLTSILAVPMGIAVDTAGSKLYWTNTRGRIQSANLNGSSIKNVMQNLSDPTDIVVSNGFIYWTEGGNSVRRVNISGQVKIAIDVAVNLNTVGGLAVGGGKVYWTEMTSATAGTVNGANLNGTNFAALATLLSAPMGISVDTAGSKLYWTNARGRVQSANLDGSGIKNVVEGLISASKIAIGGANTETTTVKAATPAKKDNAKYDVNGDGKVDNTDASLVASGLDTGNAKYDVDGDGTVNFLDLLLIFDNRDDDAAAAPAIVGMKLNAVQIDRIEEQIDLLIATNDRSPAALRTLVYMQQLLATARPEKTQLFANYPNPFNPETWIPYELATDTHVTITIYNTQGVVIRTLQFGHQSAGYYTDRDRAAYWDGRNALGEQVASGLYFYQLETDEMSSMRKMVILK